tara:strand:- start:37 stop:297 length:261 start_codon:yes stop_codon:yes gene_type:complete
MEQSQDNLPKIKILGMEKDINGKLNVEFEVCDEFLDYAKFELQKEELSQDELGDYVSNLIHKCLNEEDGYSIQKDFKENKKTSIDN